MAGLHLPRRALLGGLAAAAALPWLPAARATPAASQRRFLFVQALGGWDLTKVFAPVLDSADVEVEPEAALGLAGALPYVDHPNRPSVAAFFDRWGDQAALLHGLYVASIAHPSAIRLLLSGSLDAADADWATRIAAQAPDDPVLPHLVVGGLYYAGELGVHVGRAGSAGQLQGLSTGELLSQSDQRVVAPDPALSGEVDAWLAQAIASAQEGAGTAARAHRLDAHAQALERAGRVKDSEGLLDFRGGDVLDEQVAVAVAALSQGVSRCVTLAHPRRDDQVEWDTHALNEGVQSELFEDLFAGLGRLMDALQASPGPAGGSLADETVVVVLSELARTPTLNASNGRDHWPCTSALILGPGVRGGQAVGAYNAQLYGQPVDLASGEASESGTWLGPEHLGATLLALADIDPREAGVPAEPIEGLLA